MNAMDPPLDGSAVKSHTLLLDSRVFAFHAVQEASFVFKALEK
jgi:hypothetical protein